MLIQTGEDARALELLAPSRKTFRTSSRFSPASGSFTTSGVIWPAPWITWNAPIAVRPPNDGLLISLADSHERLGNSEKARQYFERSLELNPDHPGIRERLTGLKEDD